MTAIGRIIAFGTLLAAVAGCGDRFQFVGKWKGMSKVEVNPGIPEDVANSLRSVRLTIDGNNHFDLFAGGQSLAGRVETSGDEATLVPDTYMNMPLDRQPDEIKSVDRSVRLKGNPDGTIGFDQLQTGHVVLKRESQPGS